MLLNDPSVKYEWFSEFEGRWIVTLLNNRQIRRSRYIMAKFLCCKDFYLPEILIVHHNDFTKMNDLLENLSLKTNSQHTALHKSFIPLKYGIRFQDNHSLYWKERLRINPEIVRTSARKYYSNHQEQCQQRAKESYYRHWETRKAQMRSYMNRKKGGEVNGNKTRTNST